VFGALLVALGLAMDAVAAGAVRGLTAPQVRVRDVARIAGLTGGFQGGMAALGWLAGDRLGGVVARFDHWIAFVILGALGAKSIHAAVTEDETPKAPSAPFAWRGLVLLAIATSIDALAAGVTLPLLAVPGEVAVALIAGVTAVLVAAAVPLGRRLGARLGGRLEIVGGLALLAIGTKILIEHLTA